MPVFAYRARTAAGRAEHGLVDADSVRSAWQQLRARGIFPTALDPSAVAGDERVAPADRAAATRELAALVAAGVPIADALEGVAADATDPAIGRALTRVRARAKRAERSRPCWTASRATAPRPSCGARGSAPRSSTPR